MSKIYKSETNATPPEVKLGDLFYFTESSGTEPYSPCMLIQGFAFFLSHPSSIWPQSIEDLAKNIQDGDAVLYPSKTRFIIEQE